VFALVILVILVTLSKNAWFSAPFKMTSAKIPGHLGHLEQLVESVESVESREKPWKCKGN
jgi:hypothetical protein